MKNLYELRNSVYGIYLSVYNNWKNTDRQYNGDEHILDEENHFTFADDMVVYLTNPKTAEAEIDNYIKRMLSRFCKKNKQAYYEMILSTMVMSNVFFELGYENLSELCADWYSKLFYDEEFIYKYITEEEISEMWRLR